MNAREDPEKIRPLGATTCWASCTISRTPASEHYLSDADLRAAADYLGLAYSFVYGVATFYTMYSLKPRGRNLIRVCQSPPCHLLGSTTISRELIRLLGVGFGETTADKLFTLEMTSCLGVCGVAPAMMVNDEVYGNLTAERIARDHRGPEEGKMSIYRTHILLPVDEGTVQAGVFEVKRRLEKELQARKLENEIKVLESGSVGIVGKGVILVVYPERIYYFNVTEDDIAAHHRRAPAQGAGGRRTWRTPRWQPWPRTRAAPGSG